MPKLFDRVKVNIPTTGTGTVTFGAVPSNAFLTPAESGAIDADTVRYLLIDGTDFEEGVGTIQSSIAQMARTTVTRSKIAGVYGSSKINLSGTATLVFTASAADILNPANNLSDVASVATARTSLGATATGVALFTANNALAARTVINAVPSSKSANYTAVSGDLGASLILTGSNTLSFDAAATLANGWCVSVRNDGSGIWTLDPNGSEQIDGQTTIRLYPGETCQIVCDGSGFKTFGRSTGLVFVRKQVVSSSTASVSFASNFNADFDEYELHITDLTPVNSNVGLLLRLTEDGSTYASGSSDYFCSQLYYGNVFSGNAAVGPSTPTIGNDSKISLGGGVGNSAGKAMHFRIAFYNPAGTVNQKFIRATGSIEQTSLALECMSNSLYQKSVNAVVGCQLYLDSGNIAGGTFSLFGIRKGV